MDFAIKKVLPHVYHLHFEDHYQLVMHFIRMQEFYESPKFADKIFTLVDYMEWYAKEYGKGVFTYPKDWSGFNVPRWVVQQVYGDVHLAGIKDPNKYDDFIARIISKITEEEGTSPYYLIGSSSAGYKGDGNEKGVLDHELAHAMYFTDKFYKEDTHKLLFSQARKWATQPGSHGGSYIEFISDNPRGNWITYAQDILQKMNYHPRTTTDEIQAYAATGPCKALEDVLTPEIREPFIDNFKKHLERCQSQV